VVVCKLRTSFAPNSINDSTNDIVKPPDPISELVVAGLDRRGDDAYH